MIAFVIFAVNKLICGVHDLITISQETLEGLEYTHFPIATSSYLYVLYLYTDDDITMFIGLLVFPLWSVISCFLFCLITS